ncbi:hypothetical protein DL93DRAFT_2232352 [Clavulina sp. PMI_390]|nr:hypothetical protein DL93DRAFT_2232352 [Clavulina sp. PMI_390]
MAQVPIVNQDVNATTAPQPVAADLGDQPLTHNNLAAPQTPDTTMFTPLWFLLHPTEAQLFVYGRRRATPPSPNERCMCLMCQGASLLQDTHPLFRRNSQTIHDLTLALEARRDSLPHDPSFVHPSHVDPASPSVPLVHQAPPTAAASVGDNHASMNDLPPLDIPPPAVGAHRQHHQEIRRASHR